MKYGIYLIAVLPQSGYGAGNDRQVLRRLKILTYQEVSLLWIDQTDLFINYRLITVEGLDSDCILCVPDPRVHFWTAAVMPFIVKGILIIFPNYVEYIHSLGDTMNDLIKEEYNKIIKYYLILSKLKQISIGFGFLSNDEFTDEFIEKMDRENQYIVSVEKTSFDNIFPFIKDFVQKLE